MKKLRFFAKVMVLVFTFCFIGHSQPENMGNLVTREEFSGSSANNLSNIGYQVIDSVVKDSDLSLVVRLCSNQNMEIAIGTATINPVTLTLFFSKSRLFERITADKIFVQLSRTCSSSEVFSTATEVWLVSGKYVKENRSDLLEIGRIRLTVYRSRIDLTNDLLVGTRSYKRAFYFMLRELNRRKIDRGIIIGYKDGNILSKSVDKQLKWVNRFIGKNNKSLSLKKIFVCDLFWNRGDEDGIISNVEILGVRIENNRKSRMPIFETEFID
jgi:hypothetical protein